MWRDLAIGTAILIGVFLILSRDGSFTEVMNVGVGQSVDLIRVLQGQNATSGPSAQRAATRQTRYA